MARRPRLKMRLGDLLVHEGVISEAHLSEALASQKTSGRKLGDLLIELGHLEENQLLDFLSQQLGVPRVDLSEKRVEASVAKLVPEVQARRHRALVIEADEQTALVAMGDPADLTAIDALSAILAPREIQLAVVSERQLLDSFDSLYRRTEEIEQFASQLQQESRDEDELDLSTMVDSDDDDDVTVARLLKSIFADAVQIRASDIHIEPEETGLRIRQRVDGQLQENILDERGIASALVLRLKLMAGLDISEKRLPQDGRFQIKVRNHDIDVRLSTLPVQYGEACVMRLLDQSQGLLSIEQTGMPENMIKKVRYHMTRPHGMILVTGPTGSGKTTTLYAILSELNQPHKKIITVEDPVEYRLPRISQVQVNSKIGLNFGRVLRTTLRQDPDILMVGEMRDQETVEIGLRGAITGHLVLSTLHTNDAITSAMRLIDMGGAPYLVASALRAIIAQRLVRRICEHCKTPHQPDAQQKALLRSVVSDVPEDAQFYHGRGCQRCNFSGYRGRVGVFELLEINEPMMTALRLEDTQAFSVAARESKDFKTLAEVGLGYAVAGLTTVAEVLTLAAGTPVFDDVEAELVADTDEGSD
ncbi:type II/IV secretion system protein [Aliidiomarina halalkaliphila]|uniref:Type II/IV secretion system protein n=1 Tax=Aliidiomarina halalkaliphila TaxID=2593535 RepID=A0A552X636_9GAMM|nr:GspE/PulE family protein [Aliidiomarina halalkaliphila]TRW50466.1 type II/IV secretion system protein [Aliidiomarina halalkaliphila]